jgi:hypothetical protein
MDGWIETLREQPLFDMEALFPSEDSSFAHELRLASIVMAEGDRFQIGLEDKDTKDGFVLHLGQRKRGVELVSVDFDRGEAVLKKGEQRALVHLESRSCSRATCAWGW